MLSPVSRERWNTLRGEKVAHRGVHVLIGAAHVEALVLQHRGKRRHRSPADADQMGSNGWHDSCSTINHHEDTKDTKIPVNDLPSRRGSRSGQS